ncbi:MAG: SDR family oxidoreductase, partial [Patescibacteria group bacterium]
MKLNNKIALVTGASKGIGKATAIALTKEGCSVVVNFKSDNESAKKVLDECNRYSKKNMLFRADVSNEKEVSEMCKKIKQQFSHLDIVVNNAGIFDKRDNPTSVEAFENVFRNNFLSVVMVIKHTIPLMPEGKIINVSSIHGRLGHGRPSAAAYSAFKAALENYTKNLAK